MSRKRISFRVIDRATARIRMMHSECSEIFERVSCKECFEFTGHGSSRVTTILSYLFTPLPSHTVHFP